jgi:hypothetical protein
MIGIHDKDIAMHSRDFAAASLTPQGDKGLEVGAKSMAMAAVELLTRPELLAEIRKEFEGKRL